MATKFIEPGGDSTFDISLWDAPGQTNPVVATDFVHGGHIKSFKYATGSGVSAGKHTVFQDAGARMSFWIYVNAYPTATASIMDVLTSSYGSGVFVLRLTNTGTTQLFSSGVQLGSNGSTVPTGTWTRISFAYTLTSTTAYTFKSWQNGSASLNVSNTGTLAATGTSDIFLGNISGDTTLDIRTSDHYIDNSSALTDPGTIWVTAKRPFSNGTTNGFTTQIGSGGSGYGTGHAPQVNERPLSTTNGWSMVGAGSAVTEEYTIEAASAGDISLTGATIVDFMGWVSAKALASETGSIIVAGVSSNISVTSTITIFEKIAGSTTYPAGGTDIGVITSATVTTFSLYECGIVVAYNPAVASTANAFGLLGVG